MVNTIIMNYYYTTTTTMYSEIIQFQKYLIENNKQILLIIL
jgi:hypothetical protein